MASEWGIWPKARTTALPYVASWTSANEDLANVTANQGPMRFNVDELDGADYLTLQFANLADGVSPTFRLVLCDMATPDGAGEPLPILNKEVAPVTINPGPRQYADDSAGLYFMHTVDVDIRGMSSSKNSKEWFLMCTSVAASETHLVYYHPWNER